MPIIFPKNCRGATTGALRQMKQSGITTACGGLVTQSFERDFVGNFHDVFFDKREPCGGFMATLEKVNEEINESTEAIRTAGIVLVQTAIEANKKLADVSGKIRDGTDKLGVAIYKLMKVAGRSDFASVVENTEKLVDSLERLAALEEKGVLDKVMKAMQP